MHLLPTALLPNAAEGESSPVIEELDGDAWSDGGRSELRLPSPAVDAREADNGVTMGELGAAESPAGAGGFAWAEAVVVDTEEEEEEEGPLRLSPALADSSAGTKGLQGCSSEEGKDASVRMLRKATRGRAWWTWSSGREVPSSRNSSLTRSHLRTSARREGWPWPAAAGP